DAAENRSRCRVLDDIRNEDSARSQFGNAVAQDSAQLVLVERGHAVLPADSRVAKRRRDDWDVPVDDVTGDDGPVDLEALWYREDGEGRLGHRRRRSSPNRPDGAG